MIPPHLPAPTCNIEQHHKWQRLKIILIASFFGILAGVTGSSMFIGWLWPSIAEGDTWVIARHGGGYSREQLIAVAESKMQDKIFTMYRKKSVLSGVGYFDERDKVGEGVLAISDGWLVAYLPKYDGTSKEWSVLAPNGELYTVTKALSDPQTGLLYIKIAAADEASSGSVLSATTFSTAISTRDTVFVRSNRQWVPVSVEGVVENLDAVAHADGISARTYLLSTVFKAGSLVIDEQGSVAGFVDERGNLKPVYAVSSALSGIEQKTKITYLSLGVEGWFSAEQPIVLGGRSVNGFLVTRVITSKSLLRKGDVITQINGRAVDFEHVLEAFSKQSAQVTVVRDGEVMELSIPVVEI